MLRAMVLQVAGRWEDARAVCESVSAQLPGDVNALGHPGVLAARRGDREAAVRRLREAFDHGRAFGIPLHRDVALEPLRGYPSFEGLVAAQR